MDRIRLASLGIQLPVLPTIVLGGLPGEPDWAPRLERIGLDVVCSGATRDTAETFAAAVAQVPHRACLATAAVAGALLIDGEVLDSAYRVVRDEVVELAAGSWPGDENDIARTILERIAADPSAWWVAATGLASVSPTDALNRLQEMVNGVHHVRLYLAKQQFD